jgi:cell division protein FtsW (lipid II flippase)
MRKQLGLAALFMFILGFVIIITNSPTAGIVMFGMVLIAASLILSAVILNFFAEDDFREVRHIGLETPKRSKKRTRKTVKRVKKRPVKKRKKKK